MMIALQWGEHHLSFPSGRFERVTRFGEVTTVVYGKCRF